MFYGRLRFYCILIVYAKFFMFTLFLLYLVRNDNNKDDQSMKSAYYNKEIDRLIPMLYDDIAVIWSWPQSFPH